MGDRYFTVEEANQLIPELEKILPQLQGLKREIDQKARQLREAKATARSQGAAVTEHHFLAEEAEIDFLLILANMQVDRLGELGAQLKDIDQGLIDFPARHGDREVLLCWRLGEPGIGFFHGSDDGFSGRRPIVEGM